MEHRRLISLLVCRFVYIYIYVCIIRNGIFKHRNNQLEPIQLTMYIYVQLNRMVNRLKLAQRWIYIYICESKALAVAQSASAFEWCEVDEFGCCVLCTLRVLFEVIFFGRLLARMIVESMLLS